MSHRSEGYNRDGYPKWCLYRGHVLLVRNASPEEIIEDQIADPDGLVESIFGDGRPGPDQIIYHQVGTPYAGWHVGTNVEDLSLDALGLQLLRNRNVGRVDVLLRVTRAITRVVLASNIQANSVGTAFVVRSFFLERIVLPVAYRANFVVPTLAEGALSTARAFVSFLRHHGPNFLICSAQ